MRPGELVRWVWPMLALLSTLGSIGVIEAQRARHSPEDVAVQAVGGRLISALRRQKDYYQVNHAYATRSDELGLDEANGLSWTYRVLASRVEDQPFMLLEAESGSTRLCLDAQGHLHRSSMALLPEIAAWLPAP